MVNEIEGGIDIAPTSVGEDANFEIGAGYCKIWVNHLSYN